MCRVIWVNNKLLAGRKCDISVCTNDIFKPRDYLFRGKSVFSYCGIILLTRPDYTFSQRATFFPDAFINTKPVSAGMLGDGAAFERDDNSELRLTSHYQITFSQLRNVEVLKLSRHITCGQILVWYCSIAVFSVLRIGYYPGLAQKLCIIQISCLRN